MIQNIVLKFLDGFSFLDKVISWVFKIVPNSDLFPFIPLIDDAIADFFSVFSSMLIPISYWIDIKSLLYYFFLVIYLEIFYIIIRFIVWIFLKVLKP